MTYHVQLTSRAEREVDILLGWLAQMSPQGAETWYARFNDVLKELANSPENYDLASENEGQDEGIRNVIFKTRRGKNIARFSSSAKAKFLLCTFEDPAKTLWLTTILNFHETIQPKASRLSYPPPSSFFNAASSAST